MAESAYFSKNFSAGGLKKLYDDLQNLLLHRRTTYMTAVRGINFIFKNV